MKKGRTNTLTSILAQQRLWGKSHDIALHATRDGYCTAPEDNLPWLTDDVKSDFLAGDGREFDSKRGWAKIAALHSSSALAVNFFSYWTRRDSTALERAMNLKSPIKTVRFEQKFPTGVGSRSPNLDVVLYLEDGSILAVESKFAETFRSNKHKTLSDKYFPDGQRLWERAGIPGAQEAADGLRSHNPYRFLDALQLVKHMLGLARQERPWKLKLVWFAATETETDRMEQEISAFSSSLGPDAARFSSITYQRLWLDLRKRLDNGHRRYVEYIEGRYFSSL